MATHLCESPQKLSWDQIKKLVQGNNSCIDSYICGGCSRTFETICCLHVHCMKHNGGGSYYFDHVTNTAFPKFDTSCSPSLFDTEDIKGSQEQRILKGNPVNIKRNKDIKGVDQLKMTYRATDSTVCSNKDKVTHAENDATDIGIEQAELEHVDEKDTTVGRSEKDCYSTVKVRNVERKADGSVTFEMHEDDAHLFQITASTIIEKLKEMGEFFLENRQELEVLIPTGKVLETSLPSSQSTYNPLESNKAQDAHKKSVVETPECIPTSQRTPKDSTDYTQVKGNLATLSNPEEQEVSELNSTDQDKECNDECEFNPEKGELKYLDTGSVEVNVDKEKIDMQKHEIIENLNLTPIDSVRVPKLNKRNSRILVTEREQKVTGKKYEDSAVEYSSRTRPERKRKLTTKMKESELSETLRFSNRKLTHSIDENKSVKPKKANRKGKIDKSKDDVEHDNVKLRRSDKQAATDELKDCIEKERKQAKADNMSNTSENDLCSEEILMTEGPLYVVDNDLGFPVHEQNIKSLDKETVHSDDMSVDSDKSSVSFHDAIDAEGKSIQNLRRNRRRKRQDDGKLPKYKRKDLKCGVCGKIGSMNMIKYHQQMHSNKMPFKCEVCGKCFKTAACKRGHLRQHGEKKWKCDQCPAAFFRKQYLEMHMTNHTGEMPFMCEICGMKFRMAYIVRRHVNSVHKNIRNYKCEICEKTFFRAATRDEHMKRHYEPQLQCTYCPKKFKAELDLRKHELTHTGEKQFFCPVCSQGFTQIWPYYRHMWKIHNVQKEEAKKVRIKNPDIVYMRNINKDAAKKDPGYVHEFIGKPGCTFDMRKSFSQNVRNNSTVESENISAGEHFVYNRSSASGVSREQDGTNAVYMESNSDLTDAIVLDIGDDLNGKETIVIQAEDLQNADNQQQGYIVVKDAKSGENIIIYSEFPQSEIEDSREYSSETVDNM